MNNLKRIIICTCLNGFRDKITPKGNFEEKNLNMDPSTNLEENQLSWERGLCGSLYI
jgi:hypothetical protein